MYLGDFTTPIANLQEALDQLEQAWGNAKELWDDSTSQHFEDEFLRPITPTLKSTIHATSRMREVLMRAQRECSPPEDYQ